MDYREIVIWISKDSTDILLAELYQADVQGAQIFELSDLKNQIKIYVPLKDVSEVETKINEIQTDFRNKMDEHFSYVINSEIINDDSWYTSWETNYDEISISSFVSIVPAGKEVEVNKPIVIKLNPQHAFGAGTHETTKISAQLLELLDPRGMSTVDVGTGTGVLAILAKKLMAESVVGVDIDPDSVVTAKENAVMNNETEISFAPNDLLSGISDKFDLIIANMLPEVLYEFIPQIKNNLVPSRDSRVILSGILIGRIEEITSLMNKNGFEVTEQLTGTDWAAIGFKHKEV